MKLMPPKGERGALSRTERCQRKVTLTPNSLAGAHHLAIVLIVVPGKDLVNQWSLVVDRHWPKATVIPCSSEFPNWRRSADRGLLQRHLSPRDRRPTYLIATAATASSDDFRHLLDPVPPGDLVLISDEVHRLGATSWRRVLTLDVRGGRLGLSATPERKWDADGNAAISRFFGEKVFEYRLEQA